MFSPTVSAVACNPAMHHSLDLQLSEFYCISFVGSAQHSTTGRGLRLLSPLLSHPQHYVKAGGEGGGILFTLISHGLMSKLDSSTCGEAKRS